MYRGIIEGLHDKYADVNSWDRPMYPKTSRPYYDKIAKYTSAKYVKHLQFRDRYLKALEAYNVESWEKYEDAIKDKEGYLGYKIEEE